MNSYNNRIIGCLNKMRADEFDSDFIDINIVCDGCEIPGVVRRDLFEANNLRIGDYVVVYSKRLQDVSEDLKHEDFWDYAVNTQIELHDAMLNNNIPIYHAEITEPEAQRKRRKIKEYSEMDFSDPMF